MYSGQTSPTVANGSSNRLITYKAAPGATALGDFIDLNELLNFDGSNEEENASVI